MFTIIYLVGLAFTLVFLLPASIKVYRKGKRPIYQIFIVSVLTLIFYPVLWLYAIYTVTKNPNTK